VEKKSDAEKPKRSSKSLFKKARRQPADLAFDYKDANALKFFVSERGKIMPARLTGLNATQQRAMANAVKRARQLGSLPYVSDTLRADKQRYSVTA